MKSDLLSRWITGVALALAATLVVFCASPGLFAFILLLAAVVLQIELGGLISPKPAWLARMAMIGPWLLLVAVVFCLGASARWHAVSPYLIGVFVLLVWLGVFATLVVYTVRPFLFPSRWLVYTIAALLVLLSVFSMLVFYLALGPLLAWLLIAFVAVVDTVAYMSGRRWGKRLLAPQISPGKTREGAVCGVVAGALFLLMAFCLLGINRLPQAFFVGILLGVVAVMGDLSESMLKRCFKVKDSATWLPGHGGLLDRVDALLAVTPCALALSFFLH